jgi:hypothetical protein
MADSSVEINNELTALEADLKRLEAEYNMYFSGRLPRPPWETRSRVEATVKRLDRTHITNYGIRFRFTTLQTRFSRFVDLWDRALRAREEGRAGPLSHLAPQAESSAAAATRVDDKILRVSTFSNPTKEPVKLRELYNSFIEARKLAGQERVDFERFEQLVNAQVKAIRNNKGAAEVAFRVALEDGKVMFTARAMRGADDD